MSATGTSGHTSVGRLAELAQRLKENRAAAGAMILEAPEVIVWPGPEGVQIDRIETPTPSRSLVAELMILANRVVAERLAGAGLAAPYRTQEAPKNGFEPPEGADPLWVLLRQRMLFARLEVCPAPGPHAGLGLPAYTTFTSPIRRYYDLIALRQLHALLDGRTPPYDQAAMEEALLSLQPTLRSHNQLKFRRQRYWLLKYLAQNKDQPLEAIVLLRLHDRFSLVLVETMLRIVTDRLPAGALVEGQRVMVRIAKISPLEDVVKVEVV
jgi:exoribonuclease-2